MSLTGQILIALLLDALIGDPRRLPHPVRLIGRLALRLEPLCRRILPERPAGVCTVLLVLTVTCLSGWVLIRAAGMVHPLAGEATAVFLLYTCFAARDLLDHGNRVAAALAANDLAGARRAVGMIVGRDTAELDRAGVVRACVESVAENTVDGVTAPLFWAVLAGPVGVLGYKAASTMDSLFGYRNERYRLFGWAPARLDDLLNWLPARLTGVLLAAAALILNLRPRAAWRIFRRDRFKHASPNSGHAEAAAAGALGIRLGGPSRYGDRLVDKPVIGDDGMVPDSVHIAQINRLMVTAALLAAALFLGLRLVVVRVLG
ncbi:MAG: adenosylcobinamide-phosphate synthase CbiB [Desulfobulbaceae bacterium]